MIRRLANIVITATNPAFLTPGRGRRGRDARDGSSVGAQRPMCKDMLVVRTALKDKLVKSALIIEPRSLS